MTWKRGVNGGSPEGSRALQIVLNEVHYDPAGADGGYEFVELAAVAGADGSGSLAGWRVETGNGAADGDWKVAWVGGAADRLDGGLFVVGESGVEPVPHAVADLDLQNGPDACRLVAPSGEVDVLGWGEPLGPELFEGAPAVDVSSGESLSRRPDGRDTHNNLADFTPGEPSPGAFNSPLRQLAVMEVHWPPPDASAGAAWQFRWIVRSQGRQAWSGRVRILCAVHPGETLASVAVPGALAPGEQAELSVWAAPPPGVHLLHSDPPVGREPAPWMGLGSELFVSEILAAPLTGDPEWVEVFASVALDLGSFQLEDAAGAHAAMTGGVAAGGFLVVTPDSVAFRRRWGPEAEVRQLSPWPSLNQTAAAGAVAETVRLRLGPREVAVGVVPGRGRAGASWERVARSLPGERVDSWGPSLDPAGGTPGRPNSRRGDRPVPAGSGSVRVLPRTFRPAAEGSALIVVQVGAPRRKCSVRVWDSAGRLVSRLVPWVDGAEYRAVWDGRREDGTSAPLGLYVVSARPEGHPAMRTSLVLVR